MAARKPKRAHKHPGKTPGRISPTQDVYCRARGEGATMRDACKLAGLESARAAAGVTGTEWEKGPKIQERIAYWRAKWQEKNSLTVERVLLEVARLAFFDPRRLYDSEGNLLQPADWPDDVAAAIAGIETIKKNVTTGDGKVDDVIKVRHWDKTRALEQAMKHLGLLTEKVSHSGDIKFRWMGDDEDA